MNSARLELPILVAGLLIAGCSLRMSEFSQTPYRQPAGSGVDTGTRSDTTGSSSPAGAAAYPPPQTQLPPQSQPPQAVVPPQALPPPQAQLPSQPAQLAVSAKRNSQPSLEDIKALARGGFSDDVIINTIRSSHAVYSLNNAEINDLQSAGVSSRVINFMVNPATETAPAALVLPAPVLAPSATLPAAATPAPAASTALLMTPGGGDVPQPPPPISEEVSPPLGMGYVWVPGAWTWHKGGWLWIKGQWVMPPRPTAVWVPGKWEVRRGKGVWVTGHWK